MESALDELIARIGTMPAEERAALAEEAAAGTADLKWMPNPGPQTEAFYSEADLLFYGGEAAGGKTDLIGGLALTQHQRSLIMRRQYTDLGFIIDRVREIEGSWKGFNGSPPPKLKSDDGRLIDFGAAAKLGDEQHWQGQPHDFLGIDEVVHFLEAQVRFVMGWVRSTVPGQRSRTVFASNPPATSEGDFIIGMFRPWLDPLHHNPAKSGELRWYVSDPDGKDLEVDGPEPIQFPGTDPKTGGPRKPVKPHSRTFIPASLGDNPFQRDTGYDAVLDAMPEPLRSIIRDGNFMAGRADDAWQLIPTAWIRAAQDRWTEKPPAGVPMCAMAVDPAGGGPDKSTIAMRYDAWFDKLIKKPGVETPMGTEIAGLVVMNRKDKAVVVVDMGGGYGGVPFITLQENGIEPIAYKGSETSNARTKDRKLGFYNKRTATWWKFREALDPSQMGGSPIALPPSQELLSDLTSVRFSMTQHKGVMSVKAETKEDVVKRLGHSPDEGDAVVMCWGSGDATLLGQIIPVDQRIGQGGRKPKVVTSRDHQRTKRRR
jgi:hypothetical protein